MQIESESQFLKNIISWLFEAKLTAFLIILNIAIFIYSLFMPKELLESLIFKPEYLFQFNFIPMIASWFLHGSLTHLAGNMLFLFVFGRIVEKNLSSFKMFLIYFGAAILSDVFASLVALQGGIGASGAISGLVAASMLLNPFYITYILFIPLPVIIVGWLQILSDLLGILNPVKDNIGHFAHLGGYLGVTIILFLVEGRRMLKGLIINILFLIITAIAYLKLTGFF